MVNTEYCFLKLFLLRKLYLKGELERPRDHAQNNLSILCIPIFSTQAFFFCVSLILIIFRASFPKPET